MDGDAAEFGISLARSAGRIIRDSFSRSGVDRVWQSDNSALTQTDEAVHRLVVASVRESYPEYGLVSEEDRNFAGHAVKEAEYVWVCDPLDGTIAFSSGIPVSTFSLALTRDGDVIFGVVYDPFLDRLYTARKGEGAFLNGGPIRVSQLGELKTAIIGIEGLPGHCDGTVYHGLRNRNVGAKPVSLASFAYAGCLVALGPFAGVVFGKQGPWDVAAVKILVEEAGGRATDLRGQEQRYDCPVNGIIASNGLVHDKLLALLGEC